MTTLDDAGEEEIDTTVGRGGRGSGARALSESAGPVAGGPDGPLKQFTKTVLETALKEEMTEHLGHGKNQANPDRASTNIRNGTRPKTVLTESTGQVTIEVPRDREGTFEPQQIAREAAAPAQRC